MNFVKNKNSRQILGECSENVQFLPYNKLFINQIACSEVTFFTRYSLVFTRYSLLVSFYPLLVTRCVFYSLLVGFLLITRFLPEMAKSGLNALGLNVVFLEVWFYAGGRRDYLTSSKKLV